MPTIIAHTAVVDPRAELDEDVRIGHHCVIGANVKVGRGDPFGKQRDINWAYHDRSRQPILSRMRYRRRTSRPVLSRLTDTSRYRGCECVPRVCHR